MDNKESSTESDQEDSDSDDDEEQDDESEEEIIIPTKSQKGRGRGRGRPRKPKPGEAGFDENDYVIGDLDDPFDAVFYSRDLVLYHNFGNIEIFGHETYIRFVAQETKLFIV